MLSEISWIAFFLKQPKLLNFKKCLNFFKCIANLARMKRIQKSQKLKPWKQKPWQVSKPWNQPLPPVYLPVPWWPGTAILTAAQERSLCPAQERRCKRRPSCESGAWNSCTSKLRMCCQLRGEGEIKQFPLIIHNYNSRLLGNYQTKLLYVRDPNNVRKRMKVLPGRKCPEMAQRVSTETQLTKKNKD